MFRPGLYRLSMVALEQATEPLRTSYAGHPECARIFLLLHQMN